MDRHSASCVTDAGLESVLKSIEGISGRRAILILGMHRSGTSAITRLLGLRGAALPAQPLAAAPDNQTGFWEPAEIVEIHDEMLKSAGSSWDDIAGFPKAWFLSDVARGFKPRLAAALDREYGDAPLFVLKDPRLCYLLPLWLSLLEELSITPLFVIPIRNPLEVAASLKKRNSFSDHKSFLLWLHYFLASEENTRGYSRSFIAYDSLLKDWRSVVDTIGRDIGVVWPRQSYSTDAEIERFLSAELRHHKLANDEIYARRNVADWVKVAFNWAIRAAENLPTDLQDLDNLRAELDAAERTFIPLIVEQEMSIATLSADLRQVTDVNALQIEEVRRLTEVNALQASEIQNGRNKIASQEIAIGGLRQDIQREREELCKAHASMEAAEQRLAARDKELTTLRSDADGHLQLLQATISQLEEDYAPLKIQHEMVLNSTIWRISAPLRRMANAVPRSIRLGVRRSLKVIYWIVTPHKTLQRVAFLRARQEGLTTVAHPRTEMSRAPTGGRPLLKVPIVANVGIDPSVDATAAIRNRFGNLQPMRVFRVPGERHRVTMVTDSISEGSLFGGVGTAIVLAAAIARHIGASLRVVTRLEPANTANFASVMATLRAPLPEDVEFAYAPVDGTAEIEIADSELFLTTSWWTTCSVRKIAGSSQIIYLLQEDERMFYPNGDDRLRCQETLADSGIRFIVNTQMLFEHLVEGPEPLTNLSAQGVWFEPAFPAIEAPETQPVSRSVKRNFFFYARPNNFRNLYWYGLEAIVECIEDGILDPHEWNFHFAGRDLYEIELPCGVRPTLHQNLAWSDYVALTRVIDVGLSLMATPHPSYPPLDLAAAGAIVVTNRYGQKISLDKYSHNILCVDPTVAALKQGIAAAVERSADRDRSKIQDHIQRDWDMAFRPVLDRIFPRPSQA